MYTRGEKKERESCVYSDNIIGCFQVFPVDECMEALERAGIVSYNKAN